MDALPTNRTWQPSRNHGTYQHEAITSRSRQLLLMGTWLPETCWATIRREIKNTKKWHLVGFSYPLNYDARSNHTSDISSLWLPRSPDLCRRLAVGPSVNLSLSERVSTPNRIRQLIDAAATVVDTSLENICGIIPGIRGITGLARIQINEQRFSQLTCFFFIYIRIVKIC